MISCIRNSEGFVVAYAEWETVDKSGQITRNGEHLYIQNVWIHDEFRGYIFKDLIDLIYQHPYQKKCTKVYWAEARDTTRRKILEEDDIGKSYLSVKQSRVFDKESIYKKIIGGWHEHFQKNF